MVLKRFLNVFIHEEDLLPNDVLVWDTSALSHAFEEFSHGAMSAYTSIEDPPMRTWENLRRRFLRRLESEYLTRKLLMFCDKFRCLIPSSVLREINNVKAFDDSIAIMTGNAKLVEDAYLEHKKRVEGSPKNFSKVWRPRLIYKDPRSDLVDKVERFARALRIKISREDAEGIALAMETKGVLVTGDSNQAKLANALGVRVLYTMEKKKPKIIEKKKNRIRIRY